MDTLALIGRLVAWLRTNWKDHVTALAVAAVLVIGTLWIACWLPRDNALPAREQHSLDSLAITKPFYQAERQQLVKVETTYVTRSAAAARQATISRAAADSIHGVADSLQRVAEAEHDTSSAWRAAALARLAETDSLRVANDSLAAALELQRSARLAADARDLVAVARVAALKNLNERLARDVKTAGQCTVLRFVRCPTRKEAAIAGAVVGAIGSVRIRR